jgi:hypothetical protein
MAFTEVQGEAMILLVRRLFIFIVLVLLSGCGSAPAIRTSLPASVPLAATAAACTFNLTVNLTVDLEPGRGKNVLIELRQGVIGHSKVVNRQNFHGRTGTVFFANLCAGSYFMDIGNGDDVAVTPVHQFGDYGSYQSTIRVTFSNGNVARRSRRTL